MCISLKQKRELKVHSLFLLCLSLCFSLPVNAVGILEITPTTGLSSAGRIGGPFTPNEIVYQIRNIGDAPLDWG